MLKIYIYTHRDFDVPSFVQPYQDKYCIISQGDTHVTGTDIEQVNDNTLVHLPEYKRMPYAELNGLYWLWKNDIVKTDYIGFCHYRRYFEIGDDIEDLLDKDSVFLPEPVMVINLLHQYKTCHNDADFKIIQKYIKREYPKYYSTDIDLLFRYNMFIMHRSHFNEYCEFMFNTLQNLDDSLMLNSEQDYIRHITSFDYQSKKSSTCSIQEYQYRIDGFLGERLSTIFFIKHFGMDKVKFFPYKFIENI